MHGEGVLNTHNNGNWCAPLVEGGCPSPIYRAQKCAHRTWDESVIEAFQMVFLVAILRGTRKPGGPCNKRQKEPQWWATSLQATGDRMATSGGGGGKSRISYTGVLTKFFSPLEKRGSLGTFCTFQTWPLKKGTVFTIDPIFTFSSHATGPSVPISSPPAPCWHTRNFKFLVLCLPQVLVCQFQHPLPRAPCKSRVPAQGPLLGMAIAWQPEATTTYSKAMNCLLHNHYINGDTGTCGKRQTKKLKICGIPARAAGC